MLEKTPVALTVTEALRLSEEDRIAHLAWCREFLDHHCIFRSPPGNNLLIAKSGLLSAWQFYLPIAVLDQQFAYRISLLFWDRFIENFMDRPFQLCGCESGGALLLTALQDVAYEAGVRISVFSVKKERKSYGIKNWFEGIVLRNLPVMMIDDVVASGRTLKMQAGRVLDAGLSLHDEAFCIAACKPKTPSELDVDGRKMDLHVFYKSSDFSVTWGQYVARYGKGPVFPGSIL